MNRRSFFQMALSAVGVMAVLPSMLRAEERRRGSTKTGVAVATLVDPKEATAKAVNYVHNTKDIKDKNLRTERSGVKFENQHCKGCAFYATNQETTIDGKKASACPLPFTAGKFVAAEGWCSTWAKKA